MKKVLIISPYFPPVNTADMQRVRMSLPYFREFGWDPTVIAVKPEFVESPLENNLLLTIPADVPVYRVNAFSTRITRKFGLGNLGFRSMLQILFKSISLHKANKFNLVYFSTTAFPVIILGRLLKFFFGLPYVVDIQDPWRPDHYLDKPKHERPPKFKIAYAISSFLEKKAIPQTDGIIAVSQGYITTLQQRYPSVKNAFTETITFGASEQDFIILKKVQRFENNYFSKGNGNYNILYIGRGGYDLHYSLKILFKAVALGLKNDFALFAGIRFYFIGTSYAKNGTGKKTIEPLAKEFRLGSYVFEDPDRLPYFKTLQLLQDADMLFVPGSNEANYTASKLYPYIMAQRQILAVFHEESSVVEILRKTNAGQIVTFNTVNDNINELVYKTYINLAENLKNRDSKPEVDWQAFSFYTARYMTLRQTDMFNKIVI